MYNTQSGNPEDLPSPMKLFVSTVLAAIAALIILITIVLPAEYGFDPTGVGHLLGLTELGESKSGHSHD